MQTRFPPALKGGDGLSSSVSGDCLLPIGFKRFILIETMRLVGCSSLLSNSSSTDKGGSRSDGLVLLLSSTEVASPVAAFPKASVFDCGIYLHMSVAKLSIFLSTPSSVWEVPGMDRLVPSSCWIRSGNRSGSLLIRENNASSYPHMFKLESFFRSAVASEILSS